MNFPSRPNTDIGTGYVMLFYFGMRLFVSVSWTQFLNVGNRIWFDKPLLRSLMTGRAKNRQVRGFVAPTLCERFDVMNLKNRDVALATTQASSGLLDELLLLGGCKASSDRFVVK